MSAAGMPHRGGIPGEIGDSAAGEPAGPVGHDDGVRGDATMVTMQSSGFDAEPAE